MDYGKERRGKGKIKMLDKGMKKKARSQRAKAAKPLESGPLI